MTAASPEVTDVREERQEAKPESKPLKVCDWTGMFVSKLFNDNFLFLSTRHTLLSLEADAADVVSEKAESKRASKAAKKAEKAKQAEEAKAAQAAEAEAEAAKAEAEAAKAEAEAAKAEAAEAEVEAAEAEVETAEVDVEAAEDEAAKVGGSRVKNLTTFVFWINYGCFIGILVLCSF